MKNRRTFLLRCGVVAAIALAGLAMTACESDIFRIEWLMFERVGAAYELYGYVGSARVVNIPATNNGLPVVSIRAHALANSQLTGVTIPNTVTSIGTRAFANNQLTEVTIPRSVTTMGASVFAQNPRLVGVTVPFHGLMDLDSAWGVAWRVEIPVQYLIFAP